MSNKYSAIKIVVVPCRKSEDGKYEPHYDSPHGFHHILRIYPDDSYTLIGTVFGDYDLDQATRVAEFLSEGRPVETVPTFYSDWMTRNSP